MVKLADILTMRTMPKRATYLEGYIFKELIRTILEEAGYDVVPFGWETFLSFIKKKLYEKPKNPTAERIRYAPDLMVFGEGELELLEIKARNWQGTLSWEKKFISMYKRYWPDSILVYVVPERHWFYCQRVDDIEMEIKDHDLHKEFKPFEEIFHKVDIKTLYDYKRLAGQLFGVFGTSREKDRDSFPELYNPELILALIKENGSDKQQIYEAFSCDHLVSREAFDRSIENLRSEGRIVQDGEAIKKI